MLSRALSALLITALVVLSAQSGIARIYQATGETITICGGSTVKTITIGLDGTAQTTFHACPDATLAADLSGQRAVLIGRALHGVQVSNDPQTALWQPHSTNGQHLTRGPPRAF